MPQNPPSSPPVAELLRLKVPPEAQGQRLDQTLCQLLGAEFSRTQVQRLIKDGRVGGQGRGLEASLKLKGGEELSVELLAPEPLELKPEAMALWVLHEDQHIIVVNKAPRLVVHPAPGHLGGTLVHGLLHHCGDLAGVGGKLRPGIVHRLDQDTSGALVAAKHDQAHRTLAGAFAAGHVRKEYLALVWGQPPETGRVQTGIGRHPGDRKRMSSQGSQTKAARSWWKVVHRFPSVGVSLLRVRIATGRTHQIRVHLSEAGFPVLGDRLYGGRRGRNKLSGAAGAALKAAGRQMLHAVSLSLDHPVTGQRLEITAPLPADFRAVLSSLLVLEEAGGKAVELFQSRVLPRFSPRGSGDEASRAGKGGAARRPVFKVGLTGGIATGKSTVARMFVELGAHLVDTDLLARQAVEPGSRALAEITAAFGADILDAGGGLDRQALRDLVFVDGQARARLNAIVHPRVAELLEAQLRRLVTLDIGGVVLIDVPLLFETNWQGRYAAVVLVYAPASVQVQRLMSRDHVGDREAQTALNVQMDIEEKRRLAQFVVDNSGGLEETLKQVKAIWVQLGAIAETESSRKLPDPI
ncbi:23S rRNA pseudouridine1911/1915/1917 synthase [Desulfarculales bacterium]